MRFSHLELSKYTVNVPTGFCAWVVDTVPIDPEAPAPAVLNAIVIAYVFLHRYDGRGSTFFVLWFCFQKPRSVVPPFWCNAFRAVSVFDTEHLFAPSEHYGRVIWHWRYGLYFFRVWEETKGAGAAKWLIFR